MRFKKTLIGLVVIGTLAMVAIDRSHPEPEAEGFDVCQKPVPVPMIGVYVFWYCPEMDKTWKPAWERWDEPARFERERIEEFEAEIQKLIKRA